MVMITIPTEEIIKTIEHKRVSPNGQVSVGREHAGKTVDAYIVLSDID